MPAVSLTDHGSMAGAVQLWKATRGTGVKPVDRLRGLRRRRPPRTREGQRAPDAARRRQRRLREPDQALLARLPRGLLLQAARRLGAARAARSGADRAVRLPAAAASARRSRRTAPPTPQAELDRLAQVFGRDNVYVELQNAHLDVQARILPQLAELAGEARPADRRDRRRPLPPPLRRARTRGAPLHPVRRLAQEPEPLEVRDRPLLLQDAARRWRSTSPATTTRCGARSRSPSAATSRSSSAGSCCRSFRRPRAATLRLSRRALRERPAKALRQGRRRSCSERLAYELKTIKEMGFTDYFLIVWDFIHFAKQNDISVGPGRGSAAGASSPTASRSPTSTRSATT